MCSGVDDGLAGSKFGASMNNPPKVGTKNTTMANSVRNPPTPMMSETV
jgi:hypothetical protein